MWDNLRATFKFSLFLCLLFAFFSVSGLAYIFIRNPHRRRVFFSANTHRCNRICVRILGIHVDLNGEDDWIQSSKNFLFVSNHVSYLDIFIIASVARTFFITSVEMRETPLLGHVCEMGGCLFVERRSRKNLQNEIQEVANVLARGERVTLFPEATSTNGQEVLRFRRPLFCASIESQTDVLPLAMNYRFVDGTPITGENRDWVCWYGDMTFFPHFWEILKRRRIDVSLSVLHPIAITEETEVTQLTAETHKKIVEHYSPLV